MSTNTRFDRRGIPIDGTRFIRKTRHDLVCGDSSKFTAALDALDQISADENSFRGLVSVVQGAAREAIDNHQPYRAAALIDWTRRKGNPNPNHIQKCTDLMADALASCLHPATHMKEVADLEAAVAVSQTTDDYPGLDAALAKRLLRLLPSHPQLDLLGGERLSRLLRLDFPQTRIASTNLLCGWLMDHQSRPFTDAGDADLLGQSINAHFSALSASPLGATVLSNRVTDFVTSMRRPSSALDRLLQVSLSPSSAYLHGLKPYDRSRVDGMLETNPKTLDFDRIVHFFGVTGSEIPHTKKENRSP